MEANNEIKVEMTPHMIAKLIKQETGKDVSIKTHWFKAIYEQTTESLMMYHIWYRSIHLHLYTQSMSHRPDIQPFSV